MDESEVLVHVYEVSFGMARALSPLLLGGKQIDGIWHTGIVVYNTEFFFGSMGIQSCKKGDFFLKEPASVISLGRTEIPHAVLLDHLRELASTTFRGSCYHLFDHNCNTFSNELANFLTGKGIPAEITNLPNEVKDTPIGAMIKQFIDSMESRPFSMFPEFEEGSSARGLFNSAVGFNDLPSSNSSKSLSSSASGTTSYHVNAETASCDMEMSDEREPVANEVIPPALIYNDNNVLTIYQERYDLLKGILRPNEFQNVEEVFEYLSLQEVNWSLCKNHISLLCSLVADASMRDEIRSLAGLFLVLALSRPDVRTVCVHDSAQSFLNLVKNYNVLPHGLIRIIAKCLCNFVAERKSVEWLLESYNKAPNSFAESAFSLCTHCLLDEDRDSIEIGCGISSAFLRNGMAFGDVALQIAAALIEVIISRTYSDKSEDLLWFSFSKCVKLNDQIVELAKTMGLDLKIEEEKRPSIINYTEIIRHLFI